MEGKREMLANECKLSDVSKLWKSNETHVCLDDKVPEVKYKEHKLISHSDRRWEVKT
jgi:hypothetical protein